jgi:hypothetical protein
LKAQGRSLFSIDVAGWSSLVARKAHNLEVPGSNPGPATKFLKPDQRFFFVSPKEKILPVALPHFGLAGPVE